jgi:hypothetical protein
VVIEITYDDLAVCKSSWKEDVPLHLASQEELIQFVCENNKWLGVLGNFWGLLLRAR